MRNGRNGIGIITVLLIGLAVTVYGQTQWWPMVNCSRGRDSRAPNETVLYPPLAKTGEYTTELNTYYIYDCISVYDNLLCGSAQHEPNTVIAYDLAGGDTAWTFKVPGSRASMSFVAAQNDSFVFAGGQYGTGLYALRRQTGAVAWEKPIGGLFTKDIILDGEYGFILGDSVYCLNLASGETVWAKNWKIQSSPAVDNDYVYFAGKYRFRILNKMTGDLVWERYCTQNAFGAVMVDDQAFYMCSNDTVFAYDKSNRTVKWFYHIDGATLDPWTNPFACTDDILCLTMRNNGAGNSQLMAFNKANGDSLWGVTYSGDHIYSPTIANGAVYVIERPSNDLHGYKVETGEQIFHDNSYYYTGQPIIADNKLFAIARNEVIVYENAGMVVTGPERQAPDRLVLMHNYPNPFNGATQIRYTVPVPSHVTVNVYDISGAEVATLVNDWQETGDYAVTFDTNKHELASGLYTCRLIAGSTVRTMKMVLVK